MSVPPSAVAANAFVDFGEDEAELERLVVQLVDAPTLVEIADDETAEQMRVLYGGSVKPDNAPELFACEDIDGGLIGGASLQAESFMGIYQAA